VDGGETEVKLGVAVPVIDAEVGGDPLAIREFAQAAEEIGYQDLSAPDHVLGVNVTNRPDWGGSNTSADLFQDPFVLFGFLAGCTRQIKFSTQVLILAQRQAVLIANRPPPSTCCAAGAFGSALGWLEPGRVHWPYREFPQSRPPLGVAGRSDESFMG
jgi:hypothetical protein